MPLRRSRRLTLAGGAQIQTPVLVPSISTRNVGYLEDYDTGEVRSLASLVFDWLPGQVTESLLLSAFDLYCGALGNLPLLADAKSAVREPELLMIDSGQYEARQRPPVGLQDSQAAGWTQKKMTETYQQLSSDLPLALVNWDVQDLPYDEQIRRGQAMFAEFPSAASVMLLKPHNHRAAIDPAKLGAVAPDLRPFSIVAVTEKELGEELGERLRNLAALRRVLDVADIGAPLHVFGGLDPLLTPLYIMCGAEIVDGVGWLRYAYLDDTAHHLETRALIDLDLDSRVPRRTFYTFNENLLYLADLKRRLIALVADGDLRKFSDSRGAVLCQVWERVAVLAGEA